MKSSTPISKVVNWLVGLFFIVLVACNHNSHCTQYEKTPSPHLEKALSDYIDTTKHCGNYVLVDYSDTSYLLYYLPRVTGMIYWLAKDSSAPDYYYTVSNEKVFVYDKPYKTQLPNKYEALNCSEILNNLSFRQDWDTSQQRFSNQHIDTLYYLTKYWKIRGAEVNRNGHRISEESRNSGVRWPLYIWLFDTIQARKHPPVYFVPPKLIESD